MHHYLSLKQYDTDSRHPLKLLQYFEKIIVGALEDKEELEMSYTGDAH
jgi:hypothetical protein